MKKLLLLYSSTDGHTIKILERIKNNLDNILDSDILSLDQTSSTNLEAVECIIIGASIRYGRHKPSVYKFIKQHKSILENKVTGFFNVNAVARKLDKNEVNTNPYMKKFLKLSGWKPNLLSVFAGKISYPSYGFFDKHMIRFIMWVSKGPTDITQTYEFTDWQKVDDFSMQIKNLNKQEY